LSMVVLTKFSIQKYFSAQIISIYLDFSFFSCFFHVFNFYLVLVLFLLFLHFLSNFVIFW
jgi:hypothetical protein